MADAIKTRRGESQGKLINHLYNLGAINTVLTGGFETFYLQSGGSVTYESTDIQIISVLGNVTIVGSANKIDFTQFARLKAELISNNGTFEFGLCNAKGLDFFNNGIAKTSATTVSTATTFEVDVSSVTGLYYFAMRTGGPTTAKISKIWLE